MEKVPQISSSGHSRVRVGTEGDNHVIDLILSHQALGMGPIWGALVLDGSRPSGGPAPAAETQRREEPPAWERQEGVPEGLAFQ